MIRVIYQSVSNHDYTELLGFFSEVSAMFWFILFPKQVNIMDSVIVVGNCLVI